MFVNGKEIQAFSDCVGAIYDCAIDPGAWPFALELVGGLVNGINGGVIMADPRGGSLQFQRSWNVDEEEARRFALEFAHENPLTPLFATFDVDVPYSAGTVMRVEAWEGSRLFREFAKPLGFGDSIGVTLMRSPARFASLSMVMPADAGYCGPDDLRVLALLAPHARRVLAISDMIEMRALVAAGMEAVLDALAPGVVLIDIHGRPIFANQAARDRNGLLPPLSLASGRIVVGDRTADAAFQALIEDARRGTVRPLTLGARHSAGEVAFIHALPIGGDGARGRLAPKASHALFVTRSPVAPELSRDAWAGSFGLTPGETGVLEKLVAGMEPTAISQSLGIAMPTVRTHLANLYQKTGTRRQAELMKLAISLLPPSR